MSAQVVPPTPAISFAKGSALGGWELSARYSNIDLNDATIIGGHERNATLGLRWYANNFVRISGNWVHVFDIERRVSAFDDETPDVLQMHMQFAS